MLEIGQRRGQTCRGRVRDAGQGGSRGGFDVAGGADHDGGLVLARIGFVRSVWVCYDVCRGRLQRCQRNGVKVNDL